MIYEFALLPVKADQTGAFQRAFDEVVHLLARAEGYQGHWLMQGLETPSHFHLLVQWRSLEDHTQRFEPSEDHQVFMTGLEGYLDAEPSVFHVRGSLPLRTQRAQ